LLGQASPAPGSGSGVAVWKTANWSGQFQLSISPNKSLRKGKLALGLPVGDFRERKRQRLLNIQAWMGKKSQVQPEGLSKVAHRAPCQDFFEGGFFRVMAVVFQGPFEKERSDLGALGGRGT